MTSKDFIKGVKEGTIADYEIIRYCEENILPYAKNDEERKKFLIDIIWRLLEEWWKSNKITNDNRLWHAYKLIFNHYGWQDGHIVLKEKDQQPEPEQKSKKHVTESKTKKEKGEPEPRIKFKKCLFCEDDNDRKRYIELFRKLIGAGESGTELAIIIHAGMKTAVLRKKPSYNALNEEFHVSCGYQGYDTAYRVRKHFPKEELQEELHPFVSKIEEVKKEIGESHSRE